MLAVGNSSLCRLLLPLVAPCPYRNFDLRHHSGRLRRKARRIFRPSLRPMPRGTLSSCLQACFSGHVILLHRLFAGRGQAEERTCIHDGRPLFTNAPGKTLHCLFVLLSFRNEHGYHYPASWRLVGWHRGDNAFQRAADLFSPAQAFARGHLEVSHYLLRPVGIALALLGNIRSRLPLRSPKRRGYDCADR